MKANVLPWDKMLIFLVPVLFISGLYFLVQSSVFAADPGKFSTLITIDLLVTLPVLHFLLIRKKEIPKFTVFSVFIIGMIAASFILPQEHRSFLDMVKTYALPVIEFGVLGFIIWKVRKTILSFRKEKGEEADFFTVLKKATSEAFPKGVSVLLATEIAVMYYLFHPKGGKTLAENEFSYHKKNGIALVVGTFIGIIAIETFAVHILVAKWSHIAAWVLTFLSIYTGLQLTALIRSFGKRPIVLDKENGILKLRYGFFADFELPLDAIESIDKTSRTPREKEGFEPLSQLGSLDGHNLILNLKEEYSLSGFYGIKKKFSRLGIYIDEKDRFVEEVGF